MLHVSCEGIEFLFRRWIVFYKALGEPDRAKRQTGKSEHFRMIADGQFHTSTADIHKQPQWRIELQARENTEADQPGLVLFGEHFKRDPEFGHTLDE